MQNNIQLSDLQRLSQFLHNEWETDDSTFVGFTFDSNYPDVLQINVLKNVCVIGSGDYIWSYYLPFTEIKCLISNN